jgi:hypothetical protein
MGWMIRVLGFDSQWGPGTFLFTTLSRMALGPTQLHIQWVWGALSLGLKWPGCESDHSLPPSAKAKECMELYLHSPICLPGVVLSLNKAQGQLHEFHYWTHFWPYIIPNRIHSQFLIFSLIYTIFTCLCWCCWSCHFLFLLSLVATCFVFHFVTRNEHAVCSTFDFMLQVLCSLLAFAIRYPLASLFYDV